MLGLLTCLLSVPISYAFPIAQPVDYGVDVTFAGYLPIFGGRDTDVTVHMLVEAVGKAPDDAGNPRIVSNIKDMHVFLKEQEFPFKTSSILRFFPETTVSLTPLGVIVKNDAPDQRLPVRLPGLDPKRFPEITYLPLAFPAGGIEEATPWTFKRSFNGSDVDYTVTPTSIDDDKVNLTVQIAQKSTVYEDKFGNPVDEAQADVRVPMVLEGKGRATFDRHRQIVSEMHIRATESGEATDKTGAVTKRKLETTLDIVAKPAPVR